MNLKFLSLSFLLIIFSLLVVACSQEQPPATGAAVTPNLLDTMVASTLTAYALPASATPQLSTSTQASATRSPAASQTETIIPAATATPEANVAGRICYRTDEIPAMNAYFENKDTGQVFELPIKAGQREYAVQLPNGTYIAYAWLPDFSLGGLYSAAVTCGLKPGCDDRSALEFTVQAGATHETVDLCDWYAFEVPYPPGKDPEQVHGGISGAISFPQGNSPALRVYAFNINTNYWYYFETNPGWTTYTLGDLPPGVYYVVAYDDDGNVGGHAGSDSSLTPVTVNAGQTTGGVDITVWNPPEGVFPEEPTR